MSASPAPYGARWTHRVRAVPCVVAGRIDIRHFAVGRDGTQHGPFATSEQARLARVPR